MTDETPAEYNKRNHPVLMARLADLAEFATDLGLPDYQRDLIAAVVDAPLPICIPTGLDTFYRAERAHLEYHRAINLLDIEIRTLALMSERAPTIDQSKSLSAYGDRLDGYKSYHSIVTLDTLAEPEGYCADEDIRQHNRRRQAKLNHKDRRIESRDAKQAMIDRSLAKLKAKRK